MRVLLSLIFVQLFFAAANAQPTATMEQLQKRFPDEVAVVLKRHENIDIKLSDDKLVITNENISQIMYLNEKSVNSRGENIPYDPNFYDLMKLKACTWIPTPKGYKKEEVKEFRDIKEIDDDNFYHSRRSKQFMYPAMQPGAVSECDFTYNIVDPTALGSFSFAFGVPATDMLFTVNVPDGVTIGYKQFGPMDNVKFSTTKKGKITTYSWSCDEMGKFEEKDFTWNTDLFEPHVFVYINTYQTKKDGVKKLLGDVSDYYKNNYKFIANVNKEEISDELKTVVDSIKKSNSSEEDIVKNIFYWVQDHITYIAFEDGLGGFIPRSANSVCTKKYGDCKDMASIINEMMEYAKIPGNLCWIGTRHKGYNYEQLPLPYCDNHMIAAYKKNGEYIFLDATSRFHRFGLPSMGIQGKQIMISIDENNFEVPFVPFTSAETSTTSDTVSVVINGSTLKLKGSVHMTGFAKSTNTERIKYAGAQNEKEKIKGILQRGNNKCSLDDYVIKNIDNKDKDLIVDYSLTIPDYARVIDNEFFVNLNFDKTMVSMKPDTTDRSYGAEYPFAFCSNVIYKMAIPDDMKLKKMPENINISDEYGELTLSYSMVGKEIVVDQKYKLKKAIVPLKDLRLWVADIDKAAAAYQQVVVLEKKSSNK